MVSIGATVNIVDSGAIFRMDMGFHIRIMFC